MPKDKKKNLLKKKDTKVDLIQTTEYASTLAYLKFQIQEARIKAVTAVNSELMGVYWKIGRTISENVKKGGWGAKVIDKLSKDLTLTFSDMKGFSLRNLTYMRRFYESYPDFYSNYPDFTILQQPVAKLPWGHNILLMDKLKSNEERLWYAKKAIENGWSRSMLIVWIENDLYRREGKATTNFKDTLPLPQSDLAQQATKDPYIFDFLSMDEDFRESELEKGLIDHIQKLLMEFGRGFAFVGRQVCLEVDGDEFFVDLLFYHTALHCYVVVELKTEKFKPEFAGKMNFYLGAVDRILKKEKDNPSVGLILCKSKSKLQVKIALEDIKKPVGVAEYLVSIGAKNIPEELASSLPTIEEIEAELRDEKSNLIKK